MLPTGILLNQLSTLQQLKVESTLQAQVAFDSNVLMVFNSMMMGENKAETVKNCNISERTYNKCAFPIRSTILQILNIKALNKKDQYLEEVNAVIYSASEASDSGKLKLLEEMFHQMKRFGLEQESANLLNEMADLSTMSPLFAVYKHLQVKYANIEKTNNQLYLVFEKFCIRTSNFIDGNPKGDNIKDLIKSYKKIRTLAQSTDSKVSKAILHLSTLVLASYCNQVQLLIPNNWTLAELFKISENTIGDMHFGVEKVYLENIYANCLQFAVKNAQVKLSKNFKTKMSLAKNSHTYNFGFELKTKTFQIIEESKENLIDNFIYQLKTIPFSQNSKAIYS